MSDERSLSGIWRRGRPRDNSGGLRGGGNQPCVWSGKRYQGEEWSKGSHVVLADVGKHRAATVIQSA